MGVEEEFHTVDLRTRRLTARAPGLIQRLPADGFGSELQRSVLEANSRPWIRLADLAEDVAALRRTAIAAAEPLRLGIVAAGTVPLADPAAWNRLGRKTRRHGPPPRPDDQVRVARLGGPGGPP